MNLNTLNNQFYFSLPLDFIPDGYEERYMPLLGAKKKLHNSVLDYINSNIQSITYPAINFPVTTNNQITKRKTIKHKTVGNIYDLFDDTITVTFKNVDSNICYIMLQDILNHHYLRTDKSYDDPIIVTLLDENRNALYHIQYRNVIWTSLSETVFAYNNQTIESSTFTATFTYNFIDSEFVLGKIDTISNNTY